MSKPLFPDLTPLRQMRAHPMTSRERAQMVGLLRVAWGQAHEGLVIAMRHRQEWPELAQELDQTLTRLSAHLALAERLHIRELR